MQVDLKSFHEALEKFEGTVSSGGLTADDRYGMFKEFDPYPEIKPALLNSGHLASYAVLTGMIEPFDRKQLAKPATYLVEVEGECRYRDESGDAVGFYLSADPEARRKHADVRDTVRLAPNSVCFLTLAPEFRMPAYIAARFNLLIRDVYRGLLVGTGPLVDPGFTGRLSIPIHNFTNKEYFFKASEGLVYFEFTKLTWSNPDRPYSPLPWTPEAMDMQPPFPSSKNRRRTLDDYLTEATGSGPPASSIGQTMKKLTDQVGNANSLLNIFSVSGVVAAIILFLTAWSLYIGAQQFTAAAQNELRTSRQDLAKSLSDLRYKQAELESRLKSIENADARR